MRRARVIAILSCLVLAACGGIDTRSPVTVLDCINGYDDAQVPEGSTVVLDAVALPTDRALGASGREQPSADRLFSKDGLIVSTDSAVDLRVADEWRGRFGFNWGQPADRRVEHIRVPACAPGRGEGRWLAFTGGYYVADPACVALIVTVRGAQQRVEIGIGAPCAGQDPPRNGPGV